MEIGEDRRIAIGLLVLLISYSRDRDQTAVSEANQLAMHGTRAGSSQRDDLGAPIGPLRLAEEKS